MHLAAVVGLGGNVDLEIAAAAVAVDPSGTTVESAACVDFEWHVAAVVVVAAATAEGGDSSDSGADCVVVVVAAEAIVVVAAAVAATGALRG